MLIKLSRYAGLHGNFMRKDSAGFTLLEVLITVVVLSIAATAIMNVFISTVSTSADPLIQQQAVSIAEAYMEEIQSQNFADPVVAETGAAEPGETRENYNDVQDYNGLSNVGARDQNNSAIIGLEGYNVAVAVTGQPLSGSTTITAINSMRIDVTVSHAAIDSIRLSGFRTNY